MRLGLMLVLIIVTIRPRQGRQRHGRMGWRWRINGCRIIISRMHVGWRRRRIMRVVHGHGRGLVRVVVWWDLLVLVMRCIWIIHLLLHRRRRGGAPSLIRVWRVV